MWLLITTLVYFLMNGAQVFETFVIVPKWTAAAPDSFLLLRSPYGLDLKRFWIVTHSLHELTFILAIVYCWQLPDIRHGLLILFGLHMTVRVWTLVYFAPTLIGFQQLANTGGTTTDLQRRVTNWKNLNYFRVALFIGVSLGLVLLCTKLLHR